MYLDSSFDDNRAPPNENRSIVIEAGKSVRPVSNALSFVTCCRNTGIMKRKPARGICWITLFKLPNPNILSLRRDISVRGCKFLFVLLLCHNKKDMKRIAPVIINAATYPQFSGLLSNNMPKTINISDTMESSVPKMSKSFHLSVGFDSVK